MAVRALPRPRARAPAQVATLPSAVAALTLIAPALDLVNGVQPSVLMPTAALLAGASAAAALLVVLLRFPRTSWLLAATLAAVASLGMRLVGADVAPLLSLLSIVGLGVGGAFATPETSLGDA